MLLFTWHSYMIFIKTLVYGLASSLRINVLLCYFTYISIKSFTLIAATYNVILILLKAKGKEVMEKLRRYTMYVGLLDQHTYKQEVTKDYAETLINNVVGDCNISDATGFYTHQENGKKIKEPSLRVEMLFKTEPQVFNACRTIKKALNQEAIYVTVDYIDSIAI